MAVIAARFRRNRDDKGKDPKKEAAYMALPSMDDESGLEEDLNLDSSAGDIPLQDRRFRNKESKPEEEHESNANRNDNLDPL